MNLEPKLIVEEYLKGSDFKASLGSKGIFEQTKINERFYIGDQWYGAKCGNDRPLVRYNIIKRIATYKISQILNIPLAVNFSAEGVAFRDEVSNDFSFQDENVSDSEINYMMLKFDSFYNTIAERVKLYDLNEKILRKAYISGTAVLYTYWDDTLQVCVEKNSTQTITGDICSEVLDIENIVFGDPYAESIDKQPYIILKSSKDGESVLREARLMGATLETLDGISSCINDGKIDVYTKLYKEYKKGVGYTIKSVKVCEKAVIRKSFDTSLSLYPLALFSWERKNNLIYGESEITYLIPNQIAINRMITANVWAGMTSGMPIMLVNGDTVNTKITNDPGQIIKVYGSNEDVAGAVKYVTPQSQFTEFDSTIKSLIENTLTQSGANEVALGDSRADNATALAQMREAALVPLQIIKSRFYTFSEDVARIWADFWINYYGKRAVKIKNQNSTEYIPFDASRYKNLLINVVVDVTNKNVYSEKDSIEMLFTLFDKGIINKKQLLERLPKASIPEIKALLNEAESEADDERI